MTKDDDFPAIPGYVPIKEAAKLLGISNPRMYGYVREKRIPARKAGRTLMIPLDELEHFKLNPPGRVRTKAADWRVYNSRSKLLGIDIHVQVLPGQQGRLLEKLKAIYRKQQHTFPGTIQRYIFKDDIAPSEMSIWLIWKDTERLDTGSEAFLQTARIDLDKVCETAGKKTARGSGGAASLLIGNWREPLRLTLDTSTL